MIARWTAPDFQPTLVGPRVTLRPLRPDDWGEMFAAASDPAIWAMHPERHRYEEPLFRNFFDSALEGGAAFAILANDTGEIIGSSRYIGYDAGRREVEVGATFLTRRYWGGATNREVKRLMLDHAFGFVETVVFWISENNLRSRRAMEKVGGVLRDGMQTKAHSSGPCPYVVYEIRRPRTF